VKPCSACASSATSIGPVRGVVPRSRQLPSALPQQRADGHADRPSACGPEGPLAVAPIDARSRSRSTLATDSSLFVAHVSSESDVDSAVGIIPSTAATSDGEADNGACRMGAALTRSCLVRSIRLKADRRPRPPARSAHRVGRSDLDSGRFPRGRSPGRPSVRDRCVAARCGEAEISHAALAIRLRLAGPPSA